MSMSPDMFMTPGFGSSIMNNVGAMAMVGLFAIIYLAVAVLSVAFSVVSYVFRSVGLYAIAKRRGIHHSWLAWLPVGNLWLLGSVADQYQYVAKGKIKNRRKVLLGLSVAVALAYILCFVGGVAMGIVTGMRDGSAAPGVGAGIVVALLGLVMLVVSVLLTVFRYISYYNLFASCNPNNATAFVVLGIIFPVTLPFFVFVCRKQDAGMPPRKSAVQTQPVQLPEEVAEEVEESEETVEEGFAQPEEFED